MILQAINATSSFYCFPPTSTGLVKLALHAKGYIYSIGNNKTSAPLSLNEHQPTLSIPRAEIPHLRAEYAKFLPRLAATKDFVSTRLCFYTDSADGHWLIDWHPKVSGLMLATAGCGHAFKVNTSCGRRRMNIDRVLIYTVLPHHRPRDFGPHRRQTIPFSGTKMEIYR
jgi:sarcosine oxidase/L-pipecolate oxidase